MNTSEELNNKLDELQKVLEKRASLILSMRIFHNNAKEYYACAKEYKKLDTLTRQLELEIIGLH